MKSRRARAERLSTPCCRVKLDVCFSCIDIERNVPGQRRYTKVCNTHFSESLKTTPALYGFSKGKLLVRSYMLVSQQDLPVSPLLRSTPCTCSRFILNELIGSLHSSRHCFTKHIQCKIQEGYAGDRMFSHMRLVV
jgi:hypothetical protein